MTAIVMGNGLGLERSSALVLGSRGQLGSMAFGRFGENVAVNAATGNLMINRTDEILIGQGPDSTIGRAYNSLDTASGIGSNGNWRLNAQRTVTLTSGTVNTAGSTVTRIDWDGSNTVYTWNATYSRYQNMEGAGAVDTITYASNVWTWTDGNSRVVDTYDNTNGGRITASKDPDNNQLTYTYTSGKLTRITVTDTSGTNERTDLTWSGNNLTQIVTTLQGGATVTRTRYTYDGSNRLSTVTTDLTPDDNSITDGATVVTTYTYDGSSNRVASIAQTGGALLAITYDGSNRVQSITQTLASGVTNATTFSYNTTTRVTTITDQAGQVTTMTYDTSNRLTQISLPAAHSGTTSQVLSFTYNANGDVLTETDGSGNVTTYEYDAFGNNTLVRDAKGNTIKRTYDSANRLIIDARFANPDPDGAGASQPSGSRLMRYAYSSTGHLRFSVNDVGEVTEYLYNGYGQQTASLLYRSGSYDLSSTSDTTALSESELEDWVDFADMAGVQRTDTTYDFRGNISTVRTYSEVDVNGDGLTSERYTTVTYTYDQYGNLLTRATSGVTNTEVFVYDGLGRLKSSTDLNGATTSVVFTDASNQTVATLASGLVKTSIYNLAGTLISYAESGSGITTGTTSYAYDAMGQLRMVTDATGNKTYYLYDYVGRKVADIAADGSITEYRYDKSDRLVSTTGYATRLTAPQIASLVSGGAPATILLSSVRPSSNALDVWSWRIYDTADRLIETIDGNGAATIFAYDGMSRLISTTQYANKIAGATVTGFKTTGPTTLQTPTADSSRDIVTRNFYNFDDRLIGTLDGNGYLTEIIYNEAGAKSEVTTFATVTQAANRASGSFDTLLADVDVGGDDFYTYYAYDLAGKLVYTVNNREEIVEYVYDSAGNVIHTIAYGGNITPLEGESYWRDYVTEEISSQNLLAHADTRISWAVYDAAGRAAYTIDANGGVTRLVYDSVGQVVKKISYSVLRSTTSDPSLATMNSWATTNASSANDRVSRVIYDQAGRVVYTVDPEGYVSENRYDAAGRVTLNIRYAAVYTVSDGATPTSMATLIGGTIPSTAVQTSFTYDVDGRVSDSYDGAGVRTNFVYDALGRVTDKTVAYGTADAATTRYVYDAAGRLSSQTDAYGTAEASTTSWVYSGLGFVESVTDGRGFVTSYTYDKVGRLLTTTTPIDASNNAVITKVYDAFGNVIQITDARGNNSYFSYDSLNRLKFEIDGEKYVTKYTYTIGSEIATVTRYKNKATGTIVAGDDPTVATHAGDEVTTFQRDKLDRITRVTDAESHYEQYTLDAFGNRTVVRNKLAGLTNNTFDRRGLLITETKATLTSVAANGTTQASSVTNKFEYDARGNLTKTIEAFGLTEQRTTTFTYDKMDRVLTTTGDAVVTVNTTTLLDVAAAAPVTTNVYDNRGNLIQIIDPAGAKTFYYYDDLGRQTLTINAVGTASTFTYDANGNVTTTKIYDTALTLPSTPGGTPPTPTGNYRQTDYAYDRANRLTTTTVSNVVHGYYNGSAFITGTANLVVTNTYDKNGNIISQQDANGNNVFYYYDKRGGKIAQVDQALYLTSYTLDAVGNVTKEERFATALSSAPTTSSDPAALRTSVAGNASDTITNFTYDRNGNLLTKQRTGVVAHAVNATTGALTTAATTATVTYTYNGLGEVLTVTEATGDQTSFVYDAYGRNTTVNGQSYTNHSGASVTPSTAMYYDGLSNLTRAVTNTTRVTTNSYGAGGRLTTTTDASGFATTFGYDAAGRVVKESYTRTKSDGTTTVTEAKATRYDLLGRATYNGVATWNGSSWAFGDYGQIQYNSFGEITATGGNGLWQETNAYDNAGRVWKSTSGDGIVRIYYYDKVGNQTATVTSDGTALPSSYAGISSPAWNSLTLAQVTQLQTNNSAVAFGSLAVAGMVLTYKTYDARGLNTSTVEPLRKIDRTATTYTITKQRSYNAFGEVKSETDARGNVTNYTYNTLGKLIQTSNPSVSVTAENGAITTVNPLQTNYYDLSGRLVAVMDANGNVTKRSLLAGTGYSGDEALVVKEFRPDSSIKSFGYDVFGDQRKVTDELGNVTLMDYDAMGRLTTVTHPTRAIGSAGNQSGATQTLIDYYLYDGLGQRINHWNNLYGSSVKDRTDFDALGRVTQVVDMAGHTTSSSYSWSSGVSTALAGGGSLGTFGGWTQTTTSANGLSSTNTVDYFNRTTTKTDFGNNTSNYSYNRAGQLANQTVSSTEQVNYLYYNTGALASVDDVVHISAQSASDHATSYATSGPVLDWSQHTDVITNPGSVYYNFWYRDLDEVRYRYDVDTHFYTTRIDTVTESHRYSEFEYDKDGNRTYEGAQLITTDTNTTYYNDHLERYSTYNYASDLWDYKMDRNYHTQGHTEPVYGTRPDGTYHNEWYVPYYTWYTDSWGTTLYEWVDQYGYTASGYAPPSGWNIAVPNYETYIASYYYYTTTYHTDDLYDHHTYGSSSSSGTSSADTPSTVVGSPVTSSSIWLERETITYDAMNRVTTIHDDGYNLTAPITITMEYDANGNIRRRDALYRPLNGAGTPAASNSEQDYWYKYDSMNRFVTTKGTFTGTRGSGTISRGTTGVDIAYDAAGNRATATSTVGADTRQEQYTYSADGFLALVKLSVNSGTATKLADYGLDTMGRATSYKEYDSAGTTAKYTRTSTFNNISEVTHDDTVTVKADGTYYSSTDYSYVAQSGTAAGVATGAYMGALVSSHTTNSHTPTGGSNIADPATDYINTYVMRDSAVIKTSTFKPNATTNWVTTYFYDGMGNIKQVSINDGQPRTVKYITNLMGQVMKRDVSYSSGGDAPHELHYYLAGMAIGDVTNNGTSDTDYVTSMAARLAAAGTGRFRGGATTPTSYADFDQSYDPINGYDSASGGFSYTVKAGDTLQSIALQLWGDANLWYLIAQANGLTASSALQTGISIIIPNNKIHNFHNNSSTFKVYDPNLGIGDVSPFAPELPQEQPNLNFGGWVDMANEFFAAAYEANRNDVINSLTAAHAQIQAQLAAERAQAEAAAAAEQAAAEAAAAERAAAEAAAAAERAKYANSYERYKANRNPQKEYNDMVAAGFDGGVALSLVRGSAYFGSTTQGKIIAVQNNRLALGKEQFKLSSQLWSRDGFDWWGDPLFEPTADDIAFHDWALGMAHGGADEIVGSEQYMGMTTSDSVDLMNAFNVTDVGAAARFPSSGFNPTQSDTNPNSWSSGPSKFITAVDTFGPNIGPIRTGEPTYHPDGTVTWEPSGHQIQAAQFTPFQLDPSDINTDMPDFSGGGGTTYVPGGESVAVTSNTGGGTTVYVPGVESVVVTADRMTPAQAAAFDRANPGWWNSAPISNWGTLGSPGYAGIGFNPNSPSYYSSTPPVGDVGPGGYYVDFGLGIFGVGFVLHGDRDGVTAQTGVYPSYGKVIVGYAPDGRALAETRESKIFAGADVKTPWARTGVAVESKENPLRGMAATVGPVKAGFDANGQVSIGGNLNRSPGFAYSAFQGGWQLGFEAGVAWSHTLGTRPWNPPKLK